MAQGNKDQEADHQYWIISAPNSAQGTLQRQQQRTERDSQLALNSPFRVPAELRVGTLDALMSLSDDLQKIDMFVETTAAKIARQFVELTQAVPGSQQGDASRGLTVGGATIDHYLTHFAWDEAKYPTKNSLREIVEQISTEISRLDEELRTKATEYNQLAQQLTADDRKRAGNLLTRPLYDLVTAKDVLESEYLTTLIVVVAKYQLKEWMDSYERIVEYVVPRSSKVLLEDTDHALVTVTLFKRVAEDFKNLAREKRFTVRDFHFTPAAKNTAEAERKQLESALEDARQKLLRWAMVNFAEAFVAQVHLKAVRVFVESVLRYGLPVNFQAILTQPRKGKGPSLRKALNELYKYLDSGASAASGDNEPHEPQADEYFPYVFLRLSIPEVLSRRT